MQNQTVTENTPSKDYSRYNCSRYKFFLDAPFDISSKCCSVMKKSPAHAYGRKTGRKPMTGQMASESKLRTQQWLRNGCNGFDMKSPISNPMSFWTEQDVLLYIYENKLPICSEYGEVVIDYAAMGQCDNQMSLADFGIFDKERPILKTTGCYRTGCAWCCYGLHLEKSPNRFELMYHTYQQIYDFCMRGTWTDTKPPKDGLGYWFIFEWLRKYGNIDIPVPDIEKYVEKYSNEYTDGFLKNEQC